MTTTVHLLRHGEVNNPSGLLYGRLPGFSLSPRGVEMADRVADTLADHDIAAVISSPLERALETARPVAAVHEAAVDVDDRLIEAANVFEGFAFGVGDGSLRHLRHWKHLRNPFRPSWGEPYTEIVTRMRAAMDEAAARAEGREVVLVSHQLPIWTMRLAVEGRRLWHDPRRRECSLASLTSFSYAEGEIMSVSYAEPAADLLPVSGKSFTAGA